MIAVAVSLKTESGDSYLYLDNHDEIVKTVLDSMCDEIEYVWDMEIAVHPYDSSVESSVRQLLDEASGNV